MKHENAQIVATRMNELPGISAEIVRILPATTDPIMPGDNGWDVEVTVWNQKHQRPEEEKPSGIDWWGLEGVDFQPD